MDNIKYLEPLSVEKCDIVERNWIAYNGNPDKIEKIEKVGTFHGLRFYDQQGIYGSMSLENSKVVPIRLTVEIAKFFGFISLSESLFALKALTSSGRDITLNLEFDTDKAFIKVADKEDNVQEPLSIKYLHQLQNEYLNITGMELGPLIKRNDMRNFFNLSIYR